VGRRAWGKPPPLAAGAVVGVTAPSGPVQPERLAAGLAVLREAGLEVALAPGLLDRRHFLAGEDRSRVRDLNAMLADPGIAAVLCARGGYGAMRILPACDLAPLRRRPKAVVGFSDVTALHLAFATAALVSFHGPMVECPPGGPPEPNLAGLLRALTHRGPLGPLPLPAAGPRPVTLCPGRAAGPIVGGNLTLVTATLGTPWELDTSEGLLLLEDTGEAPYRLDRHLTQLWLAGKLQAAAGFLIGELVDCAGPAGGPTALEVFAERLLPLGRPVLAGLPFGHGALRLTVPLGVLAEMDAGAGLVRILEAAVD